MKVSDSLDNVPNENVVTQLVTDQQTEELLELSGYSSLRTDPILPSDVFNTIEECSVQFVSPLLCSLHHKISNILQQ